MREKIKEIIKYMQVGVFLISLVLTLVFMVNCGIHTAKKVSNKLTKAKWSFAIPVRVVTE